MKINDLIVQYVNRESKPRVLGRYNSSEIYGIMKGYVKPKDIFEKRKIDERGCRLISEGVSIEDYLNKVFEEMGVDVEQQAKKEIKIDDEITIVAKPDYLFKKAIRELKRPMNVCEEFPDKWKPQCELYYRTFNLPVAVWQVEYPITITQLDYKPSDDLWEQIKVEVKQFHKKVKKLNEQNGLLQ